MAFHVVEEIRKRSREEWLKLLQSRFVNARIWIQENGEAAFVVGLVLGLAIVFFHKFLIFLLAVSVILGFGAYQLSYSAAELERRKSEGSEPSRSDRAASVSDAEQAPSEQAAAAEDQPVDSQNDDSALHPRQP